MAGLVHREMRDFGCVKAKLSIAGRKAYGFSYTYTVENMSHRGWTYLLKTDKAMYTVNFAARGDDRQAEGTIRSIMESMKIL